MYKFNPGKNIIIFLFSHIKKFANFEFIFAIQKPQLARRSLEYTLNMAQNKGAFFTWENTKFAPLLLLCKTGVASCEPHGHPILVAIIASNGPF